MEHLPNGQVQIDTSIKSGGTPGAYFNDDGINMMHDLFLHPARDKSHIANAETMAPILPCSSTAEQIANHICRRGLPLEQVKEFVNSKSSLQMNLLKKIFARG